MELVCLWNSMLETNDKSIAPNAQLQWQRHNSHPLLFHGFEGGQAVGLYNWCTELSASSSLLEVCQDNYTCRYTITNHAL